MPDDNKNNELSLDDIFSRIIKDEGRKKGSQVPFKFLDSYTPDDKKIFFGRDNETEEIFRKVYSDRLLLVYGKSGTGKSSIINCGLISRIPGEDVFPVNIRCGRKPYNNFITDIRKISGKDTENPIEILEEIFFENSKPVLLIFDQFEEAFIHSDFFEREKLAHSLNDVLNSRLKINIILIIREEYFASLTEFESVVPGIYRNRIRIERMNKSAACEAIIKPCRTCNVGIEENLADKIIDQLAGQSEGLELTWLQVLMDKLYRIAIKRNPENPAIKDDDLTSLGRIGNVLSDFLDEQLRSMTNGDLGEAVLKTMISKDGTRKQINIDEINEALHSTGHSVERQNLEDVLQHFIGVRIISDKNEQGYYELRHDAIAGRVFDKMTAFEKELIELKTFLDNSFKIYEQRNVLLTNNDLNYIALYESKLILNDRYKDFINTSKKEVSKIRLRRRNLTIAVAAGIIFLSTFFSVWALYERAKAMDQTRIAEEQKDGAMKANKEAEAARIIAIEREKRANENEAIAIEQKKIAEEQRRAAMEANLEAENSRKQALEEKNRAVENEKIALTAKQDAENAKNEVIETNRQANFYLYYFNSKELANKSLLMQGNDTLRALLSLSAYDLVTFGYKNFSSNQVPARYDSEVLKSLQNSTFLFEKDSLAGGEIWSVVSKNKKIVFSNNLGELTISGLETKADKILPSLINQKVIKLPVQSIIKSIYLAQTTGMLAYGTINGDVILIENIDAAPSEQKIIYNHGGNRILCLKIAEDKRWIISSSADKTIRVWDLNLQKTVRELNVDKPVSKFILTNSLCLIFANSSGDILKWNLNDLNSQPVIAYSSSEQLQYQSITDNGKYNWIAAASSGNIYIFGNNNDGTIIAPSLQIILKHKSPISQIAFSPDNNWLATASADAIMLWDLRDADIKSLDKLVPIIIENNRQIFSLSFDSESRYLLFGDNMMLHIHPVNIDEIYSRLKTMLKNKSLTDQEWKYYLKGDIENPLIK
jgi:WD40 repeat protein